MIRSLVLLLALALPSLSAAEAAREPVKVPPGAKFLDLNCYECHNDVDRKGGLDLESLAYDPSDAAAMRRWALIHDRVRNQEMPPKDKVQLEPGERADFLAVLEQTLHDTSKKREEEFGRVRSRRLNRVEYQQTIADLLGVELPVLELLPADPEKDGFSNVAEVQSTSYQLLEKFMEVSDTCLDEAFRRALHPEPAFKRVFPARVLSVGAERKNNDRQAFLINNLSVSFASDRAFHGKMDATTVPETGWYRIKIRAKAFNPQAGRGVWTQVESGVCRAKAPTMFWIGTFEARAESQEFTFVAWIEKEHMLSVRPGDRTLVWTPARNLTDLSVMTMEGATGVAVEQVEMERITPGLDQALLQQRLFGDLPVRGDRLVSATPQQDLRRLIQGFATRAFRRPVEPAQIAPYLKLAEEELTSSKSLSTALRAGYRSILNSPRFLYFIENSGKLDDYSIASRLSYFLWSQPPDVELMTCAEQGRLSQPATLRAQVDRLLNDPRAEMFVRNFSDSWLSLKKIDFTNPDPNLYPEFDHILKHAMLDETRAFLAQMIKDDLSVTNVIDSDFAMLNERIAHHYGVAGVSGTEIRKVQLDPKLHRGGIITQASVLKVTANGTTTSPIIRGVWLLENILGEHIPPPPDNAGSIEPDIRGAVSIRDQLDKHRSSASCMTCHRKIDPPGFALENFDVIGSWRQNYRALNEKKKLTKGPAVDPTYELPNGGFIRDIDDFKKIALSNPQKIAHTLAEKILTYATGAGIEFADRREVDQIVQALQSRNYGFRSLIHACVQSSIFQSK